MKPFVHLRQYSNYSLLESSFRINDIITLCKLHKMPAIALTDKQNLFGAFEFSLEAQKNGVQPILGIDLELKKIDHLELPSHILLLIKDYEGYKNIISLMTKFYNTSEDNLINLDDLKKYSRGLICLSGGISGPIGKSILSKNKLAAEKLLNEFKSIYNENFYIELTRSGIEDENKTENFFLSSAKKFNIPVVATNHNYFSDSKMHEATDALLCIKNIEKLSNPKRKSVSKEFFFKSSSEMEKIFKDIPESISNSLLIAKKCTFMLQQKKPSLPKFFNSSIDEYKELYKLSHDGLNNKILNIKKNTDTSLNKKKYEERLSYEINIIKKTGYSGYFLIVADFISWAKKNGIPVGPGRGSGAGSLVAWALGITNLDPIKYDLLFERFLNPDRVTLPDFDIDFCQERRDDVLKYVVKKYGKKKVSQIITFGTLQSRNVVRDVGRVLQLPYNQVDSIAKMIPYNPANPISLNDAINNEKKLKELQESDDSISKLLNISLKLEGLYRHASTHAAGIVIGDEDLDEKIPFYIDDEKTGLPVTQFSMKYIEDAGLIKFDFLGLKTLTIINKTCDLVNKNKKIIDINSISLNDINTFNLLKMGNTIGCFQLESRGVREYLKKLSPDRFEDVIAMISLYRPGPMEYIDNYVKRKNGEEDIIYLHPKLEPVLSETYGITIYQEQVMKIAQILAGFSLSQADTLRWAMGKRKRSLMASLKKDFIDGCIKNNVKEYQAESIFKQVETFAGYGFNKSHAAGYALIAYQTAFLKANFPIEFMTASINYELNNTDKINKYLDDAKNMNIEILKPNINYSDSFFTIELDQKNKKGIRYGLSGLKNVGSSSTVKIVKEREKRGKFKDINDFCKRLNDENINIRQLEFLIKSGSFDELDKERSNLFNNIDKIVQIIRDNGKNIDQNNLFSNNLEDNNIINLNINNKVWSKSAKLNFEYEALGFYLTQHPLEDFKIFLKKNNFLTFKEIEEKMIDVKNDEKLFYRIAALPIDSKERTSKKGNKYAYVQFSDSTSNFEAIVFSDILNSSNELIKNHDLVLLNLEVHKIENNINLRVQEIISLKQFINESNRKIKILANESVDIKKLKDHLNKYRNDSGSEIKLLVELNRKLINISIPGRYDFFNLINNKTEDIKFLN
ncbi:MAG: DNA polymerase III subunit alpha [Alphaproteobacteria bacterium]|nr:DNA polymerase III subunit alpha [Alphaproteobacteria bacterium]